MNCIEFDGYDYFDGFDVDLLFDDDVGDLVVVFDVLCLIVVNFLGDLCCEMVIICKGVEVVFD